MAKKKIVRVRPLQIDWYTNPKIAGHDWAKESHRNAWTHLKPFATTKSQKELVSKAIMFDNVNWHYWCNTVTKKQVSQIKHCLKSIKKGGSWNEMLAWVSHRHGMLMDDFTEYLEVKAYDENQEQYLKKATSQYTWLGMSVEDATEQAENRIASYRERQGL